MFKIVRREVNHVYVKIRRYFKKEVRVTVNMVMEEEGNRPYTVSGAVGYRGSATWFSDIPWEDVEGLIGELEKENRPMMFRVDHEGGFYQEMYLPVWARKELRRKLKEKVEEYK